MPNFLVALIGAIGAGAWAYSKANRRTGGNTTSALLVGGVAGIFAFIVFISLLSVLDNYLA